MVLLSVLVAFFGSFASVCSGIPIASFNWNERISNVMQDIAYRNGLYDSSGVLADLPSYDFVIVGTGSGGSSVAAGILDEEPTANILMVEAGNHERNQSLYDYVNGAFWGASEYSWKDRTEPEPGLDNRTAGINAGFALGGSSTVNLMYWARGDPKDFDNWARIVDNDTWRYDTVLPFFRKVEKYTGAHGSRYRGKSGDVIVSKTLTDTVTSQDYQDRLIMRSGWEKNADYNARTPYGVSPSQLNVKAEGSNGIRQDAFTTQLEDHLSKQTFNVLTSTYGDRVVLNSENNQVQYLIIQRNGLSYKVRAKKDYIISAGSLRTPLVLLRSGIGNCTELEAKGVVCKVNLPGVGKNLDHHPSSFLNIPYKADQIPTENVIFNIVSGQVSAEGTTLPRNLYIPFYVKQKPFVSDGIMTIALIQSHHRTRGQIELRSTDPTAKPIIRLNTYVNSQDLDDMVTGLLELIQLGASLNDSFDAPILPFGTNYIEHLKRNIIIYNPCGSVKMGLSSDSMAVVDSKLKVRGISNLRVVDSSIMPHITSFTTHNPTMMIGAKAAADILDDHYDATAATGFEN